MATFKRYNEIKINVRKGLDYTIALNVGDNIATASNFTGSTLTSRAYSRISDKFFDLEVTSTDQDLAEGKILLQVHGEDTEYADEADYICDVVEIRGSKRRIINTLVIDVSKTIISEL